MAAAEGINKLVITKKESTWGTKATASGARYRRRKSSTFQLTKDSYKSNEIRTSQQKLVGRHGTRGATGTLNGELAGSSYDDLIESGLRRNFSTGATTGVVTTISVTAGTNVFTRSSGSYVADGFTVGSVILNSGFVAGGNNGLFVILSMTTTTLTTAPLAGQTTVTVAAGASVTILVKGKRTFTPLAGHTDDSYTVEEWNPDATVSSIFLGMQVNTIGISMQPNDLAMIDFGFMGKDAEPVTGAAYFTTPTAAGGQVSYSGADGFLFINGVASTKITGLDINVNNNISQVKVIGSDSVGAKSRSALEVTASASAIFDSSTILGYFEAETEISMLYVMMSADNLDAFAIYLPVLKVGNATRDDGEKNIILSFDGDVGEYTGSAVGVEKTCIQIQDSTLV